MTDETTTPEEGTADEATNEKALATRKAGALAIADFDSSVADAGYEDIGSDDFKPPYVNILSGQSEQIADREKKIKGAEIGDLYLSDSGTVIPQDEGFYFLPVATRKAWVERTPGDDSTWVERHPWKGNPAVDKAVAQNPRNPVLGNGNVLQKNVYVIGFRLSSLEPDAEFFPAILTFKSKSLDFYSEGVAALKCHRKGVPMFAYRLHIGVQWPVSKKTGKPYPAFNITPAVQAEGDNATIDDHRDASIIEQVGGAWDQTPLYVAALALHSEIKSGAFDLGSGDPAGSDGDGEGGDAIDGVAF